jgi:hypothetical protein
MHRLIAVYSVADANEYQQIASIPGTCFGGFEQCGIAVEPKQNFFSFVAKNREVHEVHPVGDRQFCVLAELLQFGGRVGAWDWVALRDSVDNLTLWPNSYEKRPDIAGKIYIQGRGRAGVLNLKADRDVPSFPGTPAVVIVFEGASQLGLTDVNPSAIRPVWLSSDTAVAVALGEGLVKVNNNPTANYHEAYVGDPDPRIFIMFGHYVETDREDSPADDTKLGKAEFEHTVSLQSALGLALMTLLLGVGIGAFAGVLIAFRIRK